MQQLRHCFGPIEGAPPGLQNLLAAIDQAFRTDDAERGQLAPALDIAMPEAAPRDVEPHLQAAESASAQQLLLERTRLIAFEADVERALARGSGPGGGGLVACAEVIACYLQAVETVIWTLDDAGQVLSASARARGAGDAGASPAPVCLGEGWVGAVAATRQPIFVASPAVPAAPGDSPAAAEPPRGAASAGGAGGTAAGAGLESAFAGYPLLAGERLQGVLALDLRRLPSPAMRAALATVAAAIALAIDAHRTQAALRDSEERFRTFMDNSPAVAFLKDLEGRVLWVNRPFEQTFGAPLDELLGRSEAEIWPPEIARRLADQQQAVLASGQPVQTLESLPTPAGDRAFLALKFPFRNAAGSWLLGGVAIDVTEQLRTAQERECSLSALRATLDSTADGILAIDTAGRVVTCNRRFTEMWRLPQALLAANDPEELLAFAADQLADPAAFRAEIAQMPWRAPRNGIMTLKDGRILERTEVPQTHSGRIIGRVCSFRDVTAACQAEAALRASESRYRLLFEANPQPMLVFDSGTLAFVAVNDAAVSHYGYTRDDFLRMTLPDLIVPEDRPQLQDCLAVSRQTASHERRSRHRCQDGTTITVEIRSHRIYLDGRDCRLVLVTDVSERQRLEEHLRHKQKMEAIGLLAGGVAHDLNNLLTVIGGHGALLAGELAPASGAGAHLTKILRAADRAAALTRHLLAFSRQQILRRRVIDLNLLLGDMHRMLRRILREDIDLVFALAPDLGYVLADPAQLEQVVMNLVVNASDAMPEGGSLTLTTALAPLAGGERRAEIAVAEGEYVRLTVSDTGIGMSEETRARAFEPFFTTKEKGLGAGLGLSTAYGVVEQSGGTISLESRPAAGCLVSVYLPRLDRPALAEAAASPARAATAHRAGETVVVVEDEEALRALVVEVLSHRGYRVLAAASGREALDLCRRHPEAVDLLLTDVVMPQMSGPELARQMAQLHPEAKVLFMSGYPGKLSAGADYDLDEMLIEKPFTPTDLVRRVREALAAKAAIGPAGVPRSPSAPPMEDRI